MGRELVTQDDVDEFHRLYAEGHTCRQVAAITGWSYGAVQDYLGGRRTVSEDVLHDPSKYLCTYQVPAACENDDRRHLKALYDANGHGFGWWPPSLMERVYLLETAPPKVRLFWRAA